MKNCIIFIVCFFMIVLGHTTAYAQVWYVDDSKTESGNGVQWSLAFKTIQEAVNAAEEQTNDEIWVRQGNYFLSNEINITKKIGLYGGFDGTETSRDQRDWKNNETIIDGGDSTRCFNIALSGTAGQCTIDGLIIQNGYTNGNGGGLYGNGGNLSIINCRFLGNTADSYGVGGGVAFYNVQNGLISNCTFYSNRASFGGGAYIKNCYSPVIERSDFHNNSTVGSGGGGGGIYLADNNYPHVKNTILSGNTALSGGGIYIKPESSTINYPIYPSYIENCTLYDNEAEYSFGGGIRVYHSGSPPYGFVIIKNCILWENKKNTSLSVPSLNQIDNTGSTLTVTHCDVQGGYAGDANLDVDPGFVDLGANDFHLSSGSLCIDAGTDDVDLSEKDYDNNPRVMDGNGDGDPIVDMGAVEFGLDPCIFVTSPGGGESWHEGSLHSITWAHYNAGEFVKIEISRDAGTTWAGITDNTENDGSFDWTVTGLSSSTCLIRITSIEYPGVEYISAAFSVDPAFVLLTHPNGGEYSLENDSLNIHWNSEGGEFVKIELSRDAGTTWENITENTENDGLYDWTVTGPVSAVCRIRVTSIDYPSAIDVSDDDFTISYRYITLDSPTGNEYLLERDILQIAWTANAAGDFVKIELSRDAGTTWENITENTENDGLYDWSATGPSSAACRVRITSLGHPSVSDTSNDNFTIAPASLVVLFPNGGEYWSETDSRSIKWTSANAGAFVGIEISLDGGTSWDSIASSTENDGTYDWTVIDPFSEFCRIRISSIDYPELMDTSDYDFTVAAYDSDEDEMKDSWEMEVFQNLDRDGSLDWDNDGASDLEEFLNATDPKNSDTDQDGMPDGWEINNSLDPLADDADEDIDRDRYSGFREFMEGTNPRDENSKPVPMTIHVDVTHTNGIADGTRINPFGTIQEAVVFAGNDVGEEIWVRQGNYTLAAPVIISKIISLYGGFEGWEHFRYQRNWRTNKTIVDGNTAVRCFVTTAETTLDGFTIRNGFTQDDGGAIHLTADMSIVNCTFSDNQAGGSGGAVYGDEAIPDIFFSRFVSNSAGVSGGAVFSYHWSSHSMTITDTVFKDNHATEYGGALYARWGYGRNPFQMTNCTIVANTSGIKAGGLSLSAAVPSAPLTASIQNSIFWDNTAPENDQIQIISYVNLTVDHSNIQGGWAGDNNLDQDPLFTDINILDLHLKAHSPCIDMGTNFAQSLQPVDLDGLNRISDGDGNTEAVVDIGAYEYGSDPALVPPTIAVPNGGEYWDEDDAPHDITWNPGNAGQFVRIDISRDSGINWQTIFASTENDGACSWDLAPPAAPTCRIRITSITDPSLTDVSDNDFTINMDSDGDTIKDLWELEHFQTLDRDGTDDWDDDSLTDLGEYENNTDPKDKDSDDDFMPDGWEVNHNLDPLLNDALEDKDQDGFTNYREFHDKTNPEYSLSKPISRIIHVDTMNSSGIEEGTRDKPFKTLQEAVNFAGDNVGEEIWIKAGNYILTTNLQINKALALYGGFDGLETTRDQRDWLANLVVITNSQIIVTGLATIDGITITGGSGMYIDASGSSSSGPVSIKNIIFINNARAIYNYNTAVVITDSVFSANTSTGSGGAIYNYYAWISLKNCAFDHNTAGYNGGGAIYNFKTTGIIQDCLFEGNTADSNGGGAIMNVSSSPSIYNTVFSYNHTTWGGGAINNSSNAFDLSDPSSDPIIMNCIFNDNTAAYTGGAIWNWTYSSPIITNCIFTGNETDGSQGDNGGTGGAIANSSSAPRITNCTFFDNTAAVEGGALYSSGRTSSNKSPVVYNSIFYHNSAPEGTEIFNRNSSPTIRYCNVEEGYTGTGNRNSDPIFADPSTNDLHLQITSPCIDTGYNSAPDLPISDLEGKSRKFDGDNNGNKIADIGAYESGAMLPGDFDGDSDLDGSDLAILATHPYLLDMYSFTENFGM